MEEEIYNENENIFNRNKKFSKGKIRINNVNDLIKIPISQLHSIDVNTISGNLYKKIYDEALMEEEKNIQKKIKEPKGKDIINGSDKKSIKNGFQTPKGFESNIKNDKINNGSKRQKSFDKYLKMSSSSSSSSDEESEERKDFEVKRSNTNTYILTPNKKNMNLYSLNNFNRNTDSAKKRYFDNNNSYTNIKSIDKNNNYNGYYNKSQYNTDYGDNYIDKNNYKTPYSKNTVENKINNEQNYKFSYSNKNINNRNNNNNFNNNYWNNNNQPNYICNTNTNVRKNLNITYPLKKIIFSINYISTYGEEVGILGSLPILGNWDQNNVFKLKWNSGHIWKGEIDVNNNMIEDFEFKFVILSENTVKIWENGENNKFDYDSLFNQIKNKKRGTYSKYDYEYNINYGELTIYCKWVFE